MLVPPPFPFDLWLMIIKEAMTRPKTEHDFNPRPFDLEAIEGLKRASLILRSLVHSIALEYQDIETFNPGHLEKVDFGRTK